MRTTVAAALLPIIASGSECCWSNWGDASSCGGYPAGASSGRCNNNWDQSCTSSGECTSSQPVPAPVPAPSPMPVPVPVNVPVPVPRPVPSPRPTPPAPLPPSSGLLGDVINALEKSNSDGVFMYDTGTQWLPSDIYTWVDMTRAVQVMASSGIGDAKLWVGEGNNHHYGMVNIAAFLAQCMQETIRYNACDENNWSDNAVVQEHGGTVYSSASACGQVHQSYQDYTCTAEENALAGGKMACDVDPNMMKRASSQAGWYGAPAKMFCAPKSVLPHAPKWNYQSPWCPQEGGYDYQEPFPDDVPLEEYFEYVKNGGSCKDYKGIKTGGWDYCNGGGCAGSDAPLFGHPEGRTDVEGCCWWGRGVIQTTGVCNFGKLNYYMGKRAANEGRTSLYPDIDFCKTPEAICEGGPPELKWIAGFFYWLNSVQPYHDSNDGWDYLAELKNWVDGGMNVGDTNFIDGASGIVNRGCHNPPNCGTGDLHGGPERVANFKAVLKAMGYSASITV